MHSILQSNRAFRCETNPQNVFCISYILKLLVIHATLLVFQLFLSTNSVWAFFYCPFSHTPQCYNYPDWPLYRYPCSKVAMLLACLTTGKSACPILFKKISFILLSTFISPFIYLRYKRCPKHFPLSNQYIDFFSLLISLCS